MLSRISRRLKINHRNYSVRSLHNNSKLRYLHVKTSGNLSKELKDMSIHNVKINKLNENDSMKEYQIDLCDVTLKERNKIINYLEPKKVTLDLEEHVTRKDTFDINVKYEPPIASKDISCMMC